MDAPVSPLYLLERFDVGVIELDAERRVVAMNDFARRVLPVAEKQPFDRMVLSFHPERSQPKVDFLLAQAAQSAACPVSNPPPMAMIINIPERVLLIKVTRMAGADGATRGYVLVFYDITEVVSAGDAALAPSSAASQRRRLVKVPTVAGQRIVLVDAGDIVHLQSEGHYTQVATAEGRRFCNLAIGDLEGRLDPAQFMRVHRSHIVNLRRVAQLQRQAGRLLLQVEGVAEPVPVSRSSAAEVLRRLGLPTATAALADPG
ncbi:MAG: LytTR family transcriptional regulator DNA-binding domain-containing protein [Rubrivivax sp.]